jgi:hypothetical protein
MLFDLFLARYMLKQFNRALHHDPVWRVKRYDGVILEPFLRPRLDATSP